MKKFREGRVHVPWPLRGDAYTVSGEAIASQNAREKSVYNFCNRIGPRQGLPDLAFDDRMVFYGLSDFIRLHLTKPITHADINEAERFMASAHSFGGALNFDSRPWRRIVDSFDGYLPLNIKALPEGSTFLPNEPVIEVESEDSGFGEIAAMIEAVMVGMVSNMTARVTLERHWLERIRDWVREDLNLRSADSLRKIDQIARFFIHDFGMRASSCAEESELLGRCHLLVFHGTDTFNAAYQAWKMGAKRPTGTSILALAHRIVQGHDSEWNAFTKLYSASNDSGNAAIASYVADCYDFKTAVEQYLVPLAQAGSNTTIVPRPDSGDYLKDVMFVVQKAIDAGLFKEVGPIGDRAHKRAMATNLRFIQGDSMNPRKVDAILEALADYNCCPTRWGIFGVGGWLRNTPNRDTFSSAYKLCAKGADRKPVVKLAHTPAKMSVPGPSRIIRRNENGGQYNKFPTVFMYNETNGQPGQVHFNVLPDARLEYYAVRYRNSTEGPFLHPCIDNFETIQSRVINEFDRFPTELRHPVGDEVLSAGTMKIRQQTFVEHRG